MSFAICAILSNFNQMRPMKAACLWVKKPYPGSHSWYWERGEVRTELRLKFTISLCLFSVSGGTTSPRVPSPFSLFMSFTRLCALKLMLSSHSCKVGLPWHQMVIFNQSVFLDWILIAIWATVVLSVLYWTKSSCGRPSVSCPFPPWMFCMIIKKPKRFLFSVTMILDSVLNARTKLTNCVRLDSVNWLWGLTVCTFNWLWGL